MYDPLCRVVTLQDKIDDDDVLMPILSILPGRDLHVCYVRMAKLVMSARYEEETTEYIWRKSAESVRTLQRRSTQFRQLPEESQADGPPLYWRKISVSS